MGAPARLVQLQITPQCIDPPIWRRVVADEGSTLGDLHDVIQLAMRWDDDRLHGFTAGGVGYFARQPGMADEGYGLPEDEHTDGEVMPATGSKLPYEHDFGDGWMNEVRREKITSSTAPPHVRFCLEGGRACPPEDCGGPSGYCHLLDVWNDPKHPEHEWAMEWLGEHFDPEAFDAGGVNRVLRLRRRGGTERRKPGPGTARGPGTVRAPSSRTAVAASRSGKRAPVAWRPGRWGWGPRWPARSAPCP